MAHDAEDGGLAVESFRSFLLLLARTRLHGFPDARINASDVVQQTLLDAHRQRQQFRGTAPPEMAAWLRRILACNLADALRALHRGKRDVDRERSLEAELAESSARLAGWLIADQSSPSHQAARNEQELRLANALAALPDAQREAIVLHYWQGCSLAQTAEQLGCSPAAVAGLLHRGLRAGAGI
ncbi:MAG: sigma-70 family RNA polymerase sigma factor [Gemmataceae bacterium]